MYYDFVLPNSTLFDYWVVVDFRCGCRKTAMSCQGEGSCAPLQTLDAFERDFYQIGYTRCFNKICKNCLSNNVETSGNDYLNQSDLGSFCNITYDTYRD